MMEKAIVALQLLGHLAESGLPILQFTSIQADRIAELRNLQLLAPWSPLNRLGGGNPQAFHYWYQAQRILSGDR